MTESKIEIGSEDMTHCKMFVPKYVQGLRDTQQELIRSALLAICTVLCVPVAYLVVFLSDYLSALGA